MDKDKYHNLSLEANKPPKGWRTSYPDSLQPSRGSRTYPNVKLIEGK